MLGFVAYLWVSTDNPGASGLGIDAQRAAVARQAAALGGTVVAEFVDVESGRKKDRPQLAAALASCRARHAVLLIAKLGRLARNVAFISNLMEAGVEFAAADMPTVNKLTVHILAAVAEEEARMISTRTKAALAQKKIALAKVGKKLGNPNLRPGTRDQALAASKAAAATRITRANDAAADIAPAIEAIRADGISSLGGIAEALSERGIATPSGRGAWHPATVARVISRAAAACW